MILCGVPAGDDTGYAAGTAPESGLLCIEKHYAFLHSAYGINLTVIMPLETRSAYQSFPGSFRHWTTP